MLKRILATAMLLAVIISMVACGGSTPSATETPPASGSDSTAAPDSTPAGGGDSTEPPSADGKSSLIYGYEQEPSALDPHFVSDGAAFSMGSNIFEGLVWINEAGEIEPLLAEDWTISDDGLVYTFNIREGVTFHNGDPLTSADVKFSYDRAIESSFTSSRVEFIDKAEAIDEMTFEVTLKYAYAPALSVFGSQFLRIVNQKVVEEAGDSFAYDPAGGGTGPYTLDSWTSGESMVFVANENYWRELASIKEVQVIFIAEDSTRVVALQSGDLDLTKVSLLNEGKISADPNLSYDLVEGQTVNYIGFNVNTAPFDDARVRQAINYAMDKEEMLLISRESPLGGVLTATPVKSSGLGFNEELEVYPKDIEKAKQLLEEAGYGDGFTCTLYTPNNDMRKAIATYLQGCLMELGITVTIEVMEQAAVLEEITAGRTEMFIMGANSFAADADLYLYNMYHTSGPVNYVHVSDSYIDETLEQARAVTDPAEREALYKEVTEYIYNECLDIPNFWMNDLFAHKADLVIEVMPVASRHYFYGMHWVS